MITDDFKKISWLTPWMPASTEFVKELNKEVGPNHALYQHAAMAVGRRTDEDDVLFFVPDCALPFAVVHLTWTSEQEEQPEFPATVFYSSLEDWIERCMKPDHREAQGLLR
jgi:hypothetical protein